MLGNVTVKKKERCALQINVLAILLILDRSVCCCLCAGW